MNSLNDSIQNFLEEEYSKIYNLGKSKWENFEYSRKVTPAQNINVKYISTRWKY